MYANRISLTGFLGKNAETKTTRNHAAFTVLSLATKRSWKDRQSGEWQSQTTWHRIIAWGHLGDYAAALTKGTHIQIEGEIRTREYAQKPDSNRAGGATRSITEVRATSIAKLDRPTKQAEPGAATPGAVA